MRETEDIQPYFQPDYADADVVIRGCGAYCALIEVAESGEYDADYCLALCAWLRKETPDCKLLLMCPENDVKSVTAAVEAKKEGRIDDFIFYDASLEYLLSKLRAM